MINVVVMLCVVFFFKQKTAYEIRKGDWSSDVCSSDLAPAKAPLQREDLLHDGAGGRMRAGVGTMRAIAQAGGPGFLEALEPFVAGLPTHLVAATDLGHGPTWPVHILHKPQSHIHE